MMKFTKGEIISSIIQKNMEIIQLNGEQNRIFSENSEILIGRKVGDVINYSKEVQLYRNRQKELKNFKGQICEIKLEEIGDGYLTIKVYVYQILKDGSLGKTRVLADTIKVGI